MGVLGASAGRPAGLPAVRRRGRTCGGASPAARRRASKRSPRRPCCPDPRPRLQHPAILAGRRVGLHRRSRWTRQAGPFASATRAGSRGAWHQRQGTCGGRCARWLQVTLGSRSSGCRGFTKRYGSVAAVCDVSFQVARAEIFGLLGRNGAGKTTTVECLQGLRQGGRR